MTACCMAASSARPPSVPSLLTVDETSIAGIPDAKIVRIQQFPRPSSRRGEWNAVRAAARPAAPPGPTPPRRPARTSSFETCAPARWRATEVLKSIGNPAPALATAKRTLSATYSWPIQSHASMGPSCAVADIRPTAPPSGPPPRPPIATSAASPLSSICPRQRAADLSRRLRQLRHQRQRRRRRRRGPALARHRPSRARAMVAPGRAGLGPQRDRRICSTCAAALERQGPGHGLGDHRPPARQHAGPAGHAPARPGSRRPRAAARAWPPG